MTPRIAPARRRRRMLVAVAIVLIAGFGAVAVVLGPERPALTASLAFVVALAAFALALAALARLRALEFRPEVLAGDVIVPRSGTPGGPVRLLLPLQFTNAGAADGIIEWLAVRLTRDGDPKHPLLLSPVGEVDMPRFIHARRRLTEENTIEPFTSFPLEGQRALAKFVLFDVAERPRAAPLELRPGRHAFELFIKASNSPYPRLERSFEHVVEQKHVEDYREDTAIYLINYQITLPSARRALSDVEWIPGDRKGAEMFRAS